MDTYSHYNFNFSLPVKLTNNPIRIIIWQYWWWLFFSSIFIIYYFILTKLLLKRSLKFRPKIVTSYRSHGRWGDIIVSLIPIYWCLNILTHSNTLLKLNEMQTETSIITIRVRGRQWYWVYKLDVYNFFNINNFNIKIGNNKKYNITDINLLFKNKFYDCFWKNIFLNKKNINKIHISNFLENISENFNKNNNYYNLKNKNNFFKSNWYTNFNKLNIFFLKKGNKKTFKIIDNHINITFLKKKIKNNYNMVGSNNLINSNLMNLFFETKNITFKKYFYNNFFNTKNIFNKNILNKNKYSFDFKNKNGYFFKKISLIKPLKKNLLKKNFLNIIDIKFTNNISKKKLKTVQKYSLVIDQNRKLTNLLDNKKNIFDYNDSLKFRKNYSIIFEKKYKNLKKKIWSDVNYQNNFNKIYNNLYKNNVIKTNNNVNSFIKNKNNFLHNQRLLNTNSILVLPINMNITIITNSYDVIHSWFIPGLGLKMDCVPGRSTHHTLFIDSCGIYYGQCAEICGRFHHHMPIKIAALNWEHFLLWWYHNIKNLGIHQLNKDLTKLNISKIRNGKFKNTSVLKNNRPII